VLLRLRPHGLPSASRPRARACPSLRLGSSAVAAWEPGSNITNVSLAFGHAMHVLGATPECEQRQKTNHSWLSPAGCHTPLQFRFLHRQVE